VFRSFRAELLFASQFLADRICESRCDDNSGSLIQMSAITTPAPNRRIPRIQLRVDMPCSPLLAENIDIGQVGELASSTL
jgi:hypothetical protein